MYDPPSYLTEGIQIHDPKKQIPTTILHSWDYRRGVLTATALKRMREDQETFTSFQTDAETTPHKKKKYSENCLTLQQKERPRAPSVSPLTTQRKYLPRAGRDNPQRPHPTAAAAAARPQAQPPLHPLKLEKTTTTTSTANRIPKLTRFKPGFELETEVELSIIFRRPVRTYKEDLPYYPYLVPEPRVNFNLNYKG